MRETLKIFNLNHLFKSLLPLLMFILQMNSVFAQGFTVNGKVFGEAKQPVAGVTIIIDGTTKGAITDMNGNYSIDVPNKEAVLIYQFMGYITQEIKVGDKTTLNVVLEEDAISIDEVVVVGYGQQKKESVVGAISQVKGESLVNSGISNMTSAIAGKLSGVVTMQTSGQPGQDDTEIYIRGMSSWNGSSPLVLVDGVERSFSDMDPNEVETFSVLKDASATAVFGAKGANGVIIVTTKRGKKGAPKLDISASYGLKTPAMIADHIDAYTTMSLYNVGQKNEGNFELLKSERELAEWRSPSSEVNKYLYPDTDWFDLLTKTFAPEINANFNLNGGTDFVRYFASIGFTHEGSIFKAYKDDNIDTSYSNDRINYRANLDLNLTHSTVLSFNLGGAINIKSCPPEWSKEMWRGLYQSSTCLFPAYYPESLFESYPDLDYPDATGDRMAFSNDPNGNPYAKFYQGNFDQTTSSTLYSDIVLKQDLSMVTKGLSVSGKVSISSYFDNTSLTARWGFPQYEFYPERLEDGINPWVRNGQGTDIWQQGPLDVNVGTMGSGYYTNLYYEGNINYKRDFGDHSVSGLLLVNRQQKNYEASFPYYYESWVARGTYDYAGKYLLEVNLGYTGSEKFAPSNRFGFFPSLAVGYVVSNEKWFKDNVKWMNKLKLRYSDGKVGSDPGDRWLYMSEYSISKSIIYEGSVANASAQWEEAHKRDFGIEVGMFENQVHFNVDLFDEQRTNMLLTPNTTTVLIGNNGFKQLNLGAIKKHGIEIEGSYQRTTSYGLTFKFNGMFGFNENRIVAKDDLLYAPEYLKSAGKSYGAQTSGILTSGGGYFTSIDDIHNYVRPTDVANLGIGDYRYIDYNGDGRINSDDQYSIDGSLYPPISYSFGGSLSFKNFNFNILFQGAEGKYVSYDYTFENPFEQGAYRIHASALDYWTPTNQTANHSTIRYFDNTADPNRSWGDSNIMGRHWRAADYLRLKEIYLSYMFNTKRVKDVLGVSSLTVYGTANNLYTFTNLIEGDPETKYFDRGTYPQMTTYKLGLKVGF